MDDVPARLAAQRGPAAAHVLHPKAIPRPDAHRAAAPGTQDLLAPPVADQRSRPQVVDEPEAEGVGRLT